MAWVGVLGLLLVSAGTAVAVFWPRCEFHFSVNPTEMMRGRWATMTRDEVTQYLAGFSGKATTDNEIILDRLW